METTDLGPKKGETSAQFKARIEETKREMARADAQAKPPEPPPAPAPTPAPQQPEQVPPTPATNPNPEPPATKSAVTGNKEIDEWLGKKGFKTNEDVAISLRELEREFHQNKRNERPPEVPPVAPAAPPVPQPPAWNVAPPPAPAPQPAATLEQMAARYGMTVEDFERVVAVVNDMTEGKVQRHIRDAVTPLARNVQDVSHQVSRQQEIVTLMSDPIFKNPQVQFHMHRVLEENPRIFDSYPQPYRYAFNQAMLRIARTNLEGQGPRGTPEPSLVATPTGRPPTVAGGNGGGGGGAPSGISPEQVSPEVFARMSLEQKRDHLRAVGAI